MHITVTQPNGSIIVAAMHLLFELVVLQDELREHLPAKRTVDLVMVVITTSTPKKNSLP